jgi:mannose-6-phosphate isomerase
MAINTTGRVKPLRLGPNQPPRFYRGGPAIARFRGLQPGPNNVPEDWVGSTVSFFGCDGPGLTRLQDGRLLRDAVAHDPEGFLGPSHLERFGPNPALLVKLLDAGQRLPVHCHPDREFARRHLGLRFGKTEAWIVLEAAGPKPAVYLGFNETLKPATLAGWVERREWAKVKAAVNRVRVKAGQAILVPAGVPHSIGEGVFVLELQEPTDLSILLEWEGLPIDGGMDGHLGLGYETALTAVDLRLYEPSRLEALGAGKVNGLPVRDGVDRLLPDESAPFFRAERVALGAGVSFPPEFCILVVIDGIGQLRTESSDALDLRKGDTLLIPHGAGESSLSGRGVAVRCLPPAVR